jgi:UDP-N-acetylglucosamine 2-epimerase (non-hydrolysing)
MTGIVLGPTLLGGARPAAVVPAARSVLADGLAVPAEGPPLWDGHAGERIAAIIDGWLAARAESRPPAALGA